MTAQQDRLAEQTTYTTSALKSPIAALTTLPRACLLLLLPGRRFDPAAGNQSFLHLNQEIFSASMIVPAR